MNCKACGYPCLGKLCHFCTETVRLVCDGLCVSCKAPVDPADSLRQEGRCSECRSREVKVNAGTRNLLRLASNARYMRRFRGTAA